ncbi:hypothetical protein ACE1CI_03320 [Aerosakkonemataceae cyanobacterium BLCC-F50]|uniref:Uncharacterized protein n=1 Tax=Floridaenema flaviceps BLCC-F50 TaxID=3153642 RepID=A0ABV4XKK9_9CYAN
MGIKYGYSDEIKLVGQVRTNIEDLRQWCGDRINQMTLDKSSYVDGRYQLWLFHQCNLKTGEITKGYSDDRITKFSQRIYPGCNIGLLTFHGSKSGISSNGSIKPHRDHSYAIPISRSVNLGRCVFGYGDEEQNQYKLDDGDIIQFNCKVLHSVPKILTAERFSIVFWKLNQSKGYLPIH